jgi:HlyD family secretion protein
MMRISLVAVVLAGVGIGAGAYFAAEGEHQSNGASAAERPGQRSAADSESHPDGVRVEVIKPHRGGIERTTTQPGTVESFESARLFSKVSGYLKEQNVDIGDRVQRGDVLAIIDMPELEKEVDRDAAAVEQAKAHVVQMEAAITSAKADYDAAVSLIGEREADIEHAAATLAYRKKQFERIKQLVLEHAVDFKLQDEAEDHYDASRAGVSSAKASKVSAEAQASASKAKIDQAKADLEDAKAKVSVAEATLEKDRVFLDYTNIRSPYDGVVTFRGFHPGDFINARDQGASIPLLSVDRTDKMRVVVKIPDLDVPYVNKGDVATVRIDALPGRHFEGKVARVSNSEDAQTRTMRTEVDLPNNEDRLRDGMYGEVTIALEKASDALSVPSSAFVGDSRGGKATLYVVRGGKAHKVEVTIGADNGLNTEIVSGINQDDEVVVHYKGAIANGVPVAIANGK